jgi:hypothetical protein
MRKYFLHQHKCRFDAQSDDVDQQPNHCVWLGLRRVFQTLQASLFNDLDLLTQDGQLSSQPRTPQERHPRT